MAITRKEGKKLLATHGRKAIAKNQQNKIKETVKKAADFCQCLPSDFDGMTLRNVLNDCDHSNGVVLWGCYTDEELNTVVHFN
jgi:hypothetical protein